jgi:hypothetical protein
MEHASDLFRWLPYLTAAALLLGLLPRLRRWRRAVARPENLMGCAAFFHPAGISRTLSVKVFDAANFSLFPDDAAHMRRKNALLHEACLETGAKRLVIGECGHACRVAKYMGGHSSGAALVAAPCFNCLRQIEQLADYYDAAGGVTTVFELFDRAVRC